MMFCFDLFCLSRMLISVSANVACLLCMHLLVTGHCGFALLIFVGYHVLCSSVLSFCVVCAWFCPGLRGEHHEGQDAQEGRGLVVLLEEQKQ